ncbi:hypothetical protein [Aromatoleum toluclasticum]|uniref:hypothetical protein n=1 Tax=Aromatoleum toluclasticum TaxID=92003 RepID=UPI0003677976|nr:hypothetical protein [Aromatoleum toluclasticum]
MTIKKLAFEIQKHLQTSTGTDFKRTHIYELLAASFGFRSYAALCATAVFTEQSLYDRRTAGHSDRVRNRCLELGYSTVAATTVASELPAGLEDRQIGVIGINSLIGYLKDELGRGSWIDDEDDTSATEVRWRSSSDMLASPLMLDGLNAAASGGNAGAHYALALIHDPSEDDLDSLGVGSDYWYNQSKSGRVLTGVEKEWADAYARRLDSERQYVSHLREAAKRGHQDALLELAERFGDPTFFEQQGGPVKAAPDRIARIAERLDRTLDAKRWLTEAATSGDIEAMRRLIDEYDREDLVRCWTWVFLAELLGEDLTEDQNEAIHEDGSSYDDDRGGPMFVGVRRAGVELEPINAAEEAIARLAADELYSTIEDSDS